VGIGPDTLFRHAARFRAVTVASLHELKPKAVLSFSTVLRQVSFGLQRLRLPPGAHVNAVLECLPGSILIENVADELPAPPEGWLTDGADVSPVSNLLI